MRGGDPDIAAVAGLFADRTRARVLPALADGRSLPASVLAREAGVSPQAASAQLHRLSAAGLIVGERSGRHRYYRLASDQVADILEALAGAAPAEPVPPCALPLARAPSQRVGSGALARGSGSVRRR